MKIRPSMIVAGVSIVLVFLAAVVPWYPAFIASMGRKYGNGTFWDITAINNTHWVAVGITGSHPSDLNSETYGMVIIGDISMKITARWDWSSFENYTELRRVVVEDIDEDGTPEIIITGRSRNESGFFAELDILFLNGTVMHYFWRYGTDACGLGIDIIKTNSMVYIAVVSVHNNGTVFSALTVFSYNGTVYPVCNINWSSDGGYTVPRDLQTFYLGEKVYLVAGGYSKDQTGITRGEIDVFAFANMRLSREHTIIIKGSVSHIYGLIVHGNRVYAVGSRGTGDKENAVMWQYSLPELDDGGEWGYPASSRYREIEITSDGKLLITGYVYINKEMKAFLYSPTEGHAGSCERNAIGISIAIVNGVPVTAGSAENEAWATTWILRSQYNMFLGTALVVSAVIIPVVYILTKTRN